MAMSATTSSVTPTLTKFRNKLTSGSSSLNSSLFSFKRVEFLERKCAFPNRRKSSCSAADEAAIPQKIEEKFSEDPEVIQDEKDVADILEILRLLRVKRDMVFNEVRLSLMIEDPREAQRKKELNIDDPSGCTREELADALVEVNEGRIPNDRVTLRALADEMRNWPLLFDGDGGYTSTPKRESKYAKATNTGISPEVAAKRAVIDAEWDSAVSEENVEEKSLGEVLPPWVGYGVLYGISTIPILIGVTVVVILFLNSLQ